jgi:hypothetical protein
MNREDVVYALRQMEKYISEIDNEQFRMFCFGMPINTAMMPPRYELLVPDLHQEYQRRIMRLEFRIS